jgi:hypothetical protein
MTAAVGLSISINSVNFQDNTWSKIPDDSHICARTICIGLCILHMFTFVCVYVSVRTYVCMYMYVSAHVYVCVYYVLRCWGEPIYLSAGYHSNCVTLCEWLKFADNPPVALYQSLLVCQHANHLKWQLISLSALVASIVHYSALLYRVLNRIIQKVR